MTAPSKTKSSILKYLAIVAVAAGAYFAFVEFQTRLGEKALAGTGLEYHSLAEAMQLAKSEDKKVLADLSAIWCPTCRNMDKKVFSNPQVQDAIRSNYVFARIEFESEAGEAFQQRYQVNRFPTILELEADGTMARELPVTTDPQEFLHYLKNTSQPSAI